MGCRVMLGALWLVAFGLLGCDAPNELDCDDGFSSQGGRCVDVDECADDGAGHDCHASAVCVNTEGSFSCECDQGYQGDGRQCADVDECVGEGDGHDCHLEATCLNTEGGFRCDCNQGYEGSGQSCVRSRGAGLVIVNATLIDGLGAAPLSRAAIALVGKRIVEVGRTSTVFVYPDDEVLDVEDRVVMPGIINAHVHQAYSQEHLEDWAQAGVTTVRDVGASISPPPQWSGIDNWDDWVSAVLAGSPIGDLLPPAFVWRDEQRLRPESARALMAGPCVTATGGYPGGALSLHVNSETVIEDAVEITPVEDARRKVAVLVEAGADVIKICNENRWGSQSRGLLTADQIAAVVEVAHDAGLRVTAHVSADEQLATCLEADPMVDSAAHIVADWMSNANIAAMVAGGVTLVPTLAVWESLSWICNTYGKCEAVENLGRFVDAGGRVALGDDYGNSGIVLGMPLRDMELMSEAGMTNMEIIVAATRNGAFACGVLDELGTIEEGKLADLLVLSGDPLSDLGNLAGVTHVIRDGVVIRSP